MTHAAKRFILLALLIVSVSVFSYAQTGETQQQPPLKPQMTVGDLSFALNVLATVNINGSEVEAYLDVKNTLMKALDQSQKEKKGESDVLIVEMSVLTAQNFLQLFQRASIQGAAAEKYMNIKNALYASAKPSQMPVMKDQGKK